MCGIAGIVKLNGPAAPEIIAAVRRMMEAQIHRGPDDSGIVAFGAPSSSPVTPDPSGPSAVLGHRRLAIIDLSDAGHQPMANEDGSVWVTYNGEIYNFQELRTELIDRGHRFRSRTDTEVLVHGYEEWDLEGLLARLRGMFAFGLWDQRRRRLFLARDRLGEKPLYYAWQSGTLLFASELKALLASGLIERRLNPAAVVAYLTLGSVPAPLTMIEGVQALPPGCFLTLQDGRLDLERYWRLAFEEDPDLTEGEALEEVRALLKEAVRLRLVADVPVGAFLSGGVDSSAIVALMREVTGGTIRTFSMVFEEQEFSEGRFARRVAREFETEHTEYVVTAEEVLRELPRIIEAMDQPTIDGVNTYFVSKVTRQSGTIVALSGVGGDELFGGYPSFRLIPRLYRLARLTPTVPGGRWVLERALGLLGQYGRAHKLRTVFQHAPSPEAAYLAVRGLFLDEALLTLVSPEFLAHASQQWTPLGYLQDLTRDYNGASLSNTASLLELRTYMHNQLLRDTDVMSMAHSLEVRLPFLDHRLVEFLEKVPASYKFRGALKRLLLQALDGRLPKEVTDRPKWTFTFPFERWLRSDPAWRSTLEEALGRPLDGVLDTLGVNLLWNRFLQGRVHWSRVWAIAVLCLWLDHFIGRCRTTMP